MQSDVGDLFLGKLYLKRPLDFASNLLRFCVGGRRLDARERLELHGDILIVSDTHDRNRDVNQQILVGKCRDARSADRMLDAVRHSFDRHAVRFILL